MPKSIPGEKRKKAGIEQGCLDFRLSMLAAELVDLQWSRRNSGCIAGVARATIELYRVDHRPNMPASLQQLQIAQGPPY